MLASGKLPRVYCRRSDSCQSCGGITTRKIANQSDCSYVVPQEDTTAPLRASFFVKTFCLHRHLLAGLHTQKSDFFKNKIFFSNLEVLSNSVSANLRTTFLSPVIKSRTTWHSPHFWPGYCLELPDIHLDMFIVFARFAELLTSSAEIWDHHCWLYRILSIAHRLTAYRSGSSETVSELNPKIRIIAVNRLTDRQRTAASWTSFDFRNLTDSEPHSAWTRTTMMFSSSSHRNRRTIVD